MLKIKQMVTVGLVLSLPTMLLSQSPRKFFDAATKFEKSKNYEMALENYSKAIDLDAKYEKAYPARASCYEKLNKKTYFKRSVK